MLVVSHFQIWISGPQQSWRGTVNANRPSLFVVVPFLVPDIKTDTPSNGFPPLFTTLPFISTGGGEAPALRCKAQINSKDTISFVIIHDFLIGILEPVLFWQTAIKILIFD